MSFFTPEARLAFTQLRQVFIEASILHYFNSDSYIWIETDVSGYIINNVLNKLSSGTSLDGVVTKTNLSQ